MSLEELEELRKVWNDMKNLIDQIDELREKQWFGSLKYSFSSNRLSWSELLNLRLSIQAKKVRSSLDSLALKLKEMPGRLRRYEAYDHVKSLISNCIKVK